MDEPKLKVAVVGTGNWGLQHLKSFNRNRHTELCAIVSRNKDKVEERAQLYNIRGYTDIKEMYENERVDLVSICLNGMHNYKDTLYAVKQGVPLLIEKPLSFSLEEAGNLIEEIEKRNAFVSINFMHRFSKSVQNAYKTIQKNKLGQPVFVIWKLEHEGSCIEHKYRNLIESQCHGLDLIEFLCGEIESVMAEMTDATQKGYSTMSVAFKLKNGAVGSMIGSYDSIDTYKPSQFMEITGTRGKLTIEDFVRKYTFQSIGSEEVLSWSPSISNSEDGDIAYNLDKHITEICRALLLGKEPPISARCGFRALYIASKIIESFESGRRVLIT